MGIKNTLAAYALTLLVYMAGDILWVGFFAKGYYHRRMGALFSDHVNWIAASLFYLIFVCGVLVFVVYPAISGDNFKEALWKGMLFGLVTYGTFDLVSMALFKGWHADVVVIDMAWGMVITGAVSAAGFFIVKWLN
ncbi:Uncharacterized membrane protein [Desulfatibacillum alkenivorans DSM 16219]|jgi:uncharacterized membrane protein|uniref:Uncharacterized membrane protein n=1 Tax=Desulfatibacillum alkenivorans DSM 16219 TaxID=1121393 RepID=A0A1M6IAT5_9BACT|nr:DUF2177 family protein [Desulfatibacillum alkenivorans]SHJ31513.1 Uncharacterized membrane protein [Desulfatibacillum alkenivorans DSM 16219]